MPYNGRYGFHYKQKNFQTAFCNLPTIPRICQNRRIYGKIARLNLTKGDTVLDREGYRPNVGIILINNRNEVFWGKRVREHSWQFPQGGIKPGESPETAMYRELYEEVGLLPQHIKIVGRTRDWLRYDVPSHWVRREWRGSYRGQKQIWYLLRLVGRDSDINLRACHHPEFDGWRWHQYWAPVDEVIDFKRDVYLGALKELSSRFLRGMESYEDFTARLPFDNR